MSDNQEEDVGLGENGGTADGCDEEEPPAKDETGIDSTNAPDVDPSSLSSSVNNNQTSTTTTTLGTENDKEKDYDDEPKRLNDNLDNLEDDLVKKETLLTSSEVATTSPGAVAVQSGTPIDENKMDAESNDKTDHDESQQGSDFMESAAAAKSDFSTTSPSSSKPKKSKKKNKKNPATNASSTPNAPPALTAGNRRRGAAARPGAVRVRGSRYANHDEDPTSTEMFHDDGNVEEVANQANVNVNEEDDDDNLIQAELVVDKDENATITNAEILKEEDDVEFKQRRRRRQLIFTGVVLIVIAAVVIAVVVANSSGGEESGPVTIVAAPTTTAPTMAPSNVPSTLPSLAPSSAPTQLVWQMIGGSLDVVSSGILVDVLKDFPDSISRDIDLATLRRGRLGQKVTLADIRGSLIQQDVMSNGGGNMTDMLLVSAGEAMNSNTFGGSLFIPLDSIFFFCNQINCIPGNYFKELNAYTGMALSQNGETFVMHNAKEDLLEQYWLPRGRTSLFNATSGPASIGEERAPDAFLELNTFRIFDQGLPLELNQESTQMAFYGTNGEVFVCDVVTQFLPGGGFCSQYKLFDFVVFLPREVGHSLGGGPQGDVSFAYGANWFLPGQATEGSKLLYSMSIYFQQCPLSSLLSEAPFAGYNINFLDGTARVVAPVIGISHVEASSDIGTSLHSQEIVLKANNGTTTVAFSTVSLVPDSNATEPSYQVKLYQLQEGDSEWQPFATVDGLEPGDRFGESLALSDDGHLLVVGVPGLARVLIFEYSDSLQKYVPFSGGGEGVDMIQGDVDSEFGYSVSVDFERHKVLVGAPNAEIGERRNSGAAFLYGLGGITD